MPELCSETCFWPGITRCTREPSCFVSMTVWLFISNLFASSLSHHGLNTSLVCSAGALQLRDGVCFYPSVPHCPLGFSWLWWNRDEGLVLFFLSSWRSQRRAYRLTVLMLWLPEAWAVFKTPVPFNGPHMWLCMPGPSLIMGRNGKQLVQAVLFPKLPVNLGASCPLIPVNRAADELSKQHLFA